MFRILYALKDTTIYDKYPDTNTGIDQIIELTKNTLGQPYQTVLSEELGWEQTYNSRILIKFDLTPIQTINNENTVNSSSAYLNLISTEAINLPTDYTLYAYPLAEDWRNGQGNYNDDPAVKNGASWNFKSDYNTYDTWSRSNQYQDTFITGGGSWYTSSFATQSFSFDDPNISMNVTRILNSHLSGSIINNGIIIKHSSAAETGSDIFGSLKFFSRESHTIYLPKLVYYYNTGSPYTGSFTTASLVSGDFVIHCKNLKVSYRTFDDVSLRYKVRELYPEQTYQSSSIDYTGLRLPETSYYSIIDTVTNTPIVDFNEIGTKIQKDDYGHYIRINFINFLPERYYRIIYKVITDDGQTMILDHKHDFRISK